MRFWPSAIVSFALGIVLWSFVNLQGNKLEPWDDADFGLYYAIACAVSFGIGLISEERAWIMGSIVVLSMLPVMLVFNPAIGPLFVLGSFFLAILCVPAAVSALLGAVIRRRLIKET